ncbi:helix-turn-helix domain-containing protein [Rhodoplanes sp. Z2-YC6860]|uniref:helix-turn-helix domain-containing protein n=1 Tax=Rhodoplanes sp. Z2-YC6860 TaxID=674703 RepID=UPI0009FE29AC|nr:helix-turn-helix domain-containing protein [Rhodoplanes sp. Z2-YC6860]
MPRTRNHVDLAMRVAGEHFGVSIADIRSQRRSRNVHAARTWGMYLACATTEASYEEIGKHFRRDHTIVRVVERGRSHEIDDSKESAQFFETLKAQVQGLR